MDAETQRLLDLIVTMEQDPVWPWKDLPIVVPLDPEVEEKTKEIEMANPMEISPDDLALVDRIFTALMRDSESDQLARTQTRDYLVQTLGWTSIKADTAAYMAVSRK